MKQTNHQIKKIKIFGFLKKKIGFSEKQLIFLENFVFSVKCGFFFFVAVFGFLRDFLDFSNALSNHCIPEGPLDF